MLPHCLYGESYEEDSTGCNIVDEKNKLIYVLEQENTNLKQALNEIREISKVELGKGTFDTNDAEMFINEIFREKFSKVLQIIDKVLGDEK